MASLIRMESDCLWSGRRTAADCLRRIVLAPTRTVCWDGRHAHHTPFIGALMPRQVDYYYSFQSPWAYIGHKPFRDVVSAYGLRVNHKPVVLVDLFSETGGLPLMKRHPVRQRYRMVELQRWRDKRGLKFHLQPANWPFNARLADGVVIAALETGHDPDRYLRRAFAAVWEDQLNLADPAALAKLAEESGLPGQQLVERSGAEEVSAAYEQNRQDALAAEVFGSPGSWVGGG